MYIKNLALIKISLKFALLIISISLRGINDIISLWIHILVSTHVKKNIINCREHGW